MFRNFLVTALRNFRKSFSFTVINILGLGLGLACCLVVFTIINFEYAFDNWHENKDRIFRVTRIYHGDNKTSYNGIMPYPTGEAITSEIPDFDRVVQFHGPDNARFSYSDGQNDLKIFRQEGILYTNEYFFEVMDFEIVRGNPSESLKEPFKIFLSEEAAKKYFGDADPIGKILKMDNTHNIEVVGIVKNSPDNTNLPFECIASIATMKEIYPDFFTNWGMTWAFSSYVLVKPGDDIKLLEGKLDQMMEKYLDEEDIAKTKMRLQPLSEIHTDERYGDGNNYVTPALMIWAFVFLGSLILGTACLNFINLSTAQAIKRSKEVGIRKTLGSSKFQLIAQFLLETLIIVALAMMIAFSLGQVMIDLFNAALSEISYNLEYSQAVVIFSLILAVGVSFLAGFYPSMILSGYKPISALTNKININKGSGNFNLRRILVVAQFAFTTIMLIGTLIISSQVRFMKTKDLGFDPVNVVKVSTPDESETDPEVLLTTMMSKSYVKNATLSFSAPLSNSNWNSSYMIPGEPHIDGNNANIKMASDNYLDFYDIEIIAGTNIKNEFINDTTFDVVVNEALIGSLGWDDPQEVIGRTLTSGGGATKWKIRGVMKNFNMYTAQTQLRPLMLLYRPEYMHQIALRLESGKVNEYIGDIESTFREFYPSDLFEFSILQDDINESYLIEDLLHGVIQFVSILAIVLSGMGLYGLVSFMANRSAKSIGIRKVFGASTGSILRIFSREYVLLMLLAFLFAGPASYYLMNIWIEEFAYRIDIGAYYFITGFGISMLIALITVGYRSYRAATANPIESLRYE